ncbi:hypothetical protein OQ620_26760, partial [Klebsiella pneumoniae]|nr:hypothetical protein [Klebsiella pneumoniae]
VSHTAVVWLIAMAGLWFGRGWNAQTSEPWFQLISGIAIVLNAIATGMYIGAGFGPGPRDGLMTGLHARTGWSLRGIRTAIEL